MTTLFTRYARITLLALLVIAAAGAGALLSLGRQEDPTLIRRFAIVSTFFPGASAERVEALVTEPLESSIMELAEIGEIDSTSRAGVSVLFLELREDLSEAQVEQAWTKVREQVELARQGFPAGVPPTDIDRQYIGAATIIVSLSWADGGEDGFGLVSRLARDLEDRLQAMQGTEETRLYGAAEEEVRVLVEPDKLARLGLTAGDVAAALAAADVKAPAGEIRGEGLRLGVEVAGELDGLDRVRDASVITRADGVSVRVGDLARIEKGERTPPRSMATVDGRRAALVAAYLQPGLRVDHWTDRARAVIDAFKAELPRGVAAEVIFEQKAYVERRLNGLAANLAMSAALVFLVLFFTLGWRSALIVGAALPLTTLLVLFLFRLSGEPLHQMSVTGLVIALGILIDNAIVMVDEYRLLRAKGAAPLAAVDRAVRHLFGPLLASTVTTMLAFAPIALMPGSAGEFVSFIGVSVIFAVGASFLLAMTVVPAFAAWFDDARADSGARPFWETGLKGGPFAAPYRGLLRLVARRPLIGVGAAFTLPVAGFVAAAGLPMQFFPPTDRDMFQMELVLPPETALAETRRVTERATEMAKAYPGVESVSWVIGDSPPRTYYNVLAGNVGLPSAAGGWVKTASPAVTHKVVLDFQARVRAEFPSARFLVLPFEQGPPVQAPIEVFISGPDFGQLQALGDQVRSALAVSRNVVYTTAGLKMGAPVASFGADEAAAQLGGRRLAEIAGLLRADLDGAVGGSVLEGPEELLVRVILEDDARARLDALRGKPLPGGGVSTAPLGALGAVTLKPEVSVITRHNGERSNSIHGHVMPFTLPDVAMRDFLARLDAADFRIPQGYKLEVGGEQAERGESLAQLFGAAAPLLVMMLGALVLAFNSFTYAGVVSVTAVLSVGLAYFGVALMGEPNGFMAIIGAMGLVGLAVNGSIIVLTALRANPLAANGDVDAIVETTIEATRHMVSTTLTTIGGFLPLLFFSDSFWRPLAGAIAGGVAGSAVLALVFAPACFAMIARAKAAKLARRAARAAARAAAQPAQ